MRAWIVLSAVIASASAFGQDIASCSNPVGQGYFPEIGLVGKEDSGWSEEKITGGLTKVTKVADNEYDVLFVDVRKEITSARQDGGIVLLLNRGKGVFSLLVVYPGTTAEVYTFFRTTPGELAYLHTQSRAGDGVMIAKSSVMRGECAYINFDAL